MLDRLQRIAAWLMNLVRVNHLQRCLHDGFRIVVKRRRAGGTLAIWFGNRFLTLAHSGISMFVRAGEWIEWEIECAHLLYPRRHAATEGAGASVILPEIPGSSLRQLVREGELRLTPFLAAARELKRAHAIHSPHFKGPWSHGDLHLDNILYDEASDQAVLIDFDVRHESERSATWRQSDDLKVMLLELISEPGEHWRERVIAIVEEYGDTDVFRELGAQLFVPRGFAKILWHYRTNGTATRELEPRLAALRSILQRVTSMDRIVASASSCPTEGGEQSCLRDS